MGPKSILKKPSARSGTDQNGVGNEVRDLASKRHVDPRHLQVALHHADIIQQRKDIGSLILQAIEELIDFPTSPSSSSNPTLADVERFQKLISQFGTSDFDSLVEERNAVSKCGYTFCPNVIQRSSGQHQRIDWSSAKTGPLRLFPGKSIESWCCDACQHRAIFIKSQLSDKPVWERPRRMANQVMIWSGEDEDALSTKMSELGLGTAADSNIQSAMQELALERGDSKDSARIGAVLSKHVRENPSAKDSSPLKFQQLRNQSDARIVEGHLPK